MFIGVRQSAAKPKKASLLVFALLFTLVLSLTIAVQSKADDSGDVTVSVEVMDSVPANLPTAEKVVLDSGTTITNAPVDIVLVGLEPFSLVQIYAQSDPILIASGFADKYGVFKVTTNLPPTLEAGDHSVVASVQLKGQTKPSLKSLVKFAVTTNGTIHNTSKSPYKPVTESPAPSTTANAVDLIQGVLFISGVKLVSEPTINPLGAPASVEVTVMNAYNKPYTLSVDEDVKALGLIELSQVVSHQVVDLKPKEARTLVHQTPAIGQWGIYTVDFTVTPPKTLDDLTLPPVHRQTIVFIVPVLVFTVLGGLLLLELLRRFLIAPYLRGRKLLQNLIDDSGSEVKA